MIVLIALVIACVALYFAFSPKVRRGIPRRPGGQDIQWRGGRRVLSEDAAQRIVAARLRQKHNADGD